MPSTIAGNPVLHHITLKTNRPGGDDADWYEVAVEHEPNHAGPFGAWLTNDEANHRVAMLVAPGLDDDPDKIAHTGMHHLAFSTPLSTISCRPTKGSRRKRVTPHACLDHGVTTSLYYVDPGWQQRQTSRSTISETGPRRASGCGLHPSFRPIR